MSESDTADLAFEGALDERFELVECAFESEVCGVDRFAHTATLPQDAAVGGLLPRYVLREDSTRTASSARATRTSSSSPGGASRSSRTIAPSRARRTSP